MTRRRQAGAVATALLATVAALGLAACSAGTGAAGSPVATTMVDLPPSYRFAPTDIVVTAGSIVTWTNHDNFSHSVEFLDGGLPTEPLVMKPGEATTFTFAVAGTYRYQCSFHPQNMKGSVVVAP
jgi:plastocyanin